MTPITHLPGIHAVLVPEDATECQITLHAVAFKSLTSDLPKDTNGFNYIEFELCKFKNCMALGTASESEISFDVKGIVKEPFLRQSYTFRASRCSVWAFYDYEIDDYWIDDKNDSFLSALHASGLPTDNKQKYLILK